MGQYKSLTTLFMMLFMASTDHFSLKRKDHQLHLITSYGISMTMTSILRKRGLNRLQAAFVSSAATMALGIAKESFMDDRGERGDIIANTIGIGMHAVVVYTFSL